jgi:hypothetical protein
VHVLQFSTHLSQANRQRTPALDLPIHVIPDALIGAQQATEVDLDTAAALTPDTRQVDGQWAPPRQQTPFPKPIATEPLTGFRPTATASTFSTQPFWHLASPPVVAATKYVLYDGHEQCRNSQLYRSLQGRFCLQ